LYQNWFFKIYRNLNCIIYVIFKVWGLKCIFPEFSVTLPMFDAFFILIPLLPISPLSKISKAIGLQLGSNCLKLKFKDQNELLKNAQLVHNVIWVCE
jgi:hypothetical protein